MKAVTGNASWPMFCDMCYHYGVNELLFSSFHVDLFT